MICQVFPPVSPPNTRLLPHDFFCPSVRDHHKQQTGMPDATISSLLLSPREDSQYLVPMNTQRSIPAIQKTGSCPVRPSCASNKTPGRIKPSSSTCLGNSQLATWNISVSWTIDSSLDAGRRLLCGLASGLSDLNLKIIPHL